MVSEFRKLISSSKYVVCNLNTSLRRSSSEFEVKHIHIFVIDIFGVFISLLNFNTIFYDILFIENDFVNHLVPFQIQRHRPKCIACSDMLDIILLFLCMVWLNILHKRLYLQNNCFGLKSVVIIITINHEVMLCSYRFWTFNTCITNLQLHCVSNENCLFL